MLLLAILLTAGCLGGLGSSGTQHGTLSMSITDAPMADAKSVDITITKIEVKEQDSAGWTTIRDPEVEGVEPLSIDLLSLRFAEELLVPEVRIAAGTYTQIRIHTTGDGLITFDDESTAPLKIPSGVFKVMADGTRAEGRGPIEVTENGNTWIVLDVNMARFVQRGATAMYNVTPTAIRVVDRAEVTTVYGHLVNEADEPYGDAVLLQLWPEGETWGPIETLSLTNGQSDTYADNGTGDFQFNAVPYGNYTIKAFLAANGDSGDKLGLEVAVNGEGEVSQWEPLTNVSVSSNKDMQNGLDLGIIKVLPVNGNENETD